MDPATRKRIMVASVYIPATSDKEVLKEAKRRVKRWVDSGAAEPLVILGDWKMPRRGVQKKLAAWKAPGIRQVIFWQQWQLVCH